MKLNEKNWIFSGGLTPEWRQVGRRRVAQSLSRLDKIREGFERSAPPSARQRRYLAGLEYFAGRSGAARDRLVSQPSFDYWLHLWDRYFSQPCPEENWHLQFGLFQTFPALLALTLRESRELDAILDHDAHLHFYGAPFRLEFPRGLRLRLVRLSLGREKLEIRGSEGLRVALPLALLQGRSAKNLKLGSAVFRVSPEALPGISVETCAPLLTHGVTKHGVARLGSGQTKNFIKAAAAAFALIERRDAPLSAELTDMVRVLTPLNLSAPHRSVSSSYDYLKGTICLSHDDDPVLQAETLIHEFCHQKLNKLLTVEPLFAGEQSEQIYYSPWRPDPRRLRGLIFGGHAFLNVSRFLMRSLSREAPGSRSAEDLMFKAARRLLEVQTAVESACAYGRFTAFGSRFVRGLRRETASLLGQAQRFPVKVVAQARRLGAEHRRAYGRPADGYHKSCAGPAPATGSLPWTVSR